MAEGTGLMARLASDDALREAIKADPKDVLRREGVDIPDEMQVKVVESTPDTLYIALPHKTEGSTDSELSDAELEGVAGGTDAATVTATMNFNADLANATNSIIGRF